MANLITQRQLAVVKATGAEINTGTDDAKFTTAKAITDSTLVKQTVSAEGDLGTISLFAGTWATIDSKKYKYIQTGKRVDLWIRLESTTAGSGVTGIYFYPAALIPVPSAFSTQGATNYELGMPGAGSAGIDNTAVETIGLSTIAYHSSGQQFNVNFPAINCKVVNAHFTYFTA